MKVNDTVGISTLTKRGASPSRIPTSPTPVLLSTTNNARDDADRSRTPTDVTDVSNHANARAQNPSIPTRSLSAGRGGKKLSNYAQVQILFMNLQNLLITDPCVD